MDELSHIDEKGNIQMVDVGQKEKTARKAVAQAIVRTTKAVIEAVKKGLVKKGEVLAVCKVAGIQAAKRTSDLIPLCHPLPIDIVTIEIELSENLATITASAKTTAKSGLEMEAMTAATVAALTFYDMCKAMDKAIIIESVQLLEKIGGKSGHYKREGEHG